MTPYPVRWPAALLCCALLGTSVGWVWSAEKMAPLGVPGVQVPMTQLTPEATFELGDDPDWMAVGEDAVWISVSRQHAVYRIDAATNKIAAKVALPGAPDSGLAIGFGSVWVPLPGEGKTPGALARVDVATNKVVATIPVSPADAEGGITTSGDSVWLAIDGGRTLARIDPATNTIRQKIALPAGSFNPLYTDGVVWVSGFAANVLTAIDAVSGEVLATIPVGPGPRFLTSGAGSVWTLNQGDGSVTRVDMKTRRAVAMIPAGIPGHGGEICFGAGGVWATAIGVPLTAIDPATNAVARQWTGEGGDAVRFGLGTLWLTDIKHGRLWRLPFPPALAEAGPSVETRVLPRSRADRLYQLTIGLPPSFRTHPEKKYPVIFVTDGYWGFPTVRGVVGGLNYGRHLPEAIVVGLGYAGENLDFAQLRGDDLVPQEGMGIFSGGGHAEKFLQLIETQAIPLLEKEFRADPKHRYIVGSSAGGLFALYALFAKPELFHGYVADSPSVGLLWNLEREFAAAGRTTSARVFISVAENEWTGYRQEIQAFHWRMATHGEVKGGLKFRRIDGVRHSVGTGESFMQGLLFVAESIAPEHGAQTDMMTDAQGRPRFVAVFWPAASGTSATLTPAQAEVWAAHEAFLKRLAAEKRIEFGSMTPPDLSGHDSEMAFFATDRAAAEALVRDDPAVKSGLLEYELIEMEE